MHVREPSFVNLQTMPAMSEGGMIADVIAAVASIDPVMGVWTGDPEGQPESSAYGRRERLCARRGRVGPVVPEQSPLTPVFDEATRQRTAEIIARYPQSRSALLPLLHLVQSVEGYVSQDGIRYCAEVLELTTAEVSAVATFYTMYKRTPCGEHLVSVCTNTLCAALGGDAIYDRLTTKLGIGHEETAGEPGTPGSITLEHAECLAACDRAGAAGQLRVLRQPDRRDGRGSSTRSGAACARYRPAAPR